MNKHFILRWIGNTLFVALSFAILLLVVLGTMSGFAGIIWWPYCLMLMHTMYFLGFTIFYVACGFGMLFIPPNLLTKKFKILLVILVIGIVLTGLSQWLKPVSI